MSVKKEASGRRSVQVEVEVPGAPEEVWKAIATGPGISSWFVPAEFEERDGKPVAVKMNFGPGMESRAVVTVWDPPRMFAAESPGWTPEMPSMATEWSVEARAGGVCLVRVVNSLFASTDDWDNQLEGTESGWPGFFRTLRIYLTHFRGQRSAIMQKMAPAAGTEAEAWETLTAALGSWGLGAEDTSPAACRDRRIVQALSGSNSGRVEVVETSTSCKVSRRRRSSGSVSGQNQFHHIAQHGQCCPGEDPSAGPQSEENSRPRAGSGLHCLNPRVGDPEARALPRRRRDPPLLCRRPAARR
jgi:uncharacterized protein YndB with AHSA1/START domain